MSTTNKQVIMDVNDSDCEIETSDITIITINDSSDEVEQLEQQQSIIELEEGEVLDEIALNVETLFEVHFPNNDVYDKYGKILDRIIQETLSQVTNEKIECCIETTPEKSAYGLRKLIYRKQSQQQEQQKKRENQEERVAIERRCSQSEEILRKIVERRQRDVIKEQSPDLRGISNLFILDAEPNQKSEVLSVPSYKRSCKDALGNDAEEKRTESDKQQFSRKSSKHACFNCGETSHNLRECVLPREHQRIRNAMKGFKKNDRYHTSVDQRFASIEPGNISKTLRGAMALQKGELPFFFYRMRVLGYPPGWLEEAKVHRSDMTIYNADGSRILAPDEEEGEIHALSYKYNATKIIDFPGFNQYPGDNFYDDYEFYNVPPFSKLHSKEEFIKNLGDAVFYGYKRRKLQDLPSSNTTNDLDVNLITHVAEDMEIEDADDSVTEPQVFLPPEKPSRDDKSPTPLTATTSILSPVIEAANTTSITSFKDSEIEEVEENERNSSIIDSNSLNLSALEAKQQQLLKELELNNASKDSSTSTFNDDSLIDEISTMEEIPSANECSTTDDEEQEQEGRQTLHEKQTKSANIETVESSDYLKGIYLGTPILKFSIYDRLPSSEKFRQGMSDVINFENLPASTGKYEEMKKILRKVKDTMQKMQQEDDR